MDIQIVNPIPNGEPMQSEDTLQNDDLFQREESLQSESSLENISKQDEHSMKSETCIGREKQIDTEFPTLKYRKRVNYLYSQIIEEGNKFFQCMLCSFETKHLNSIQRHFLRHANTKPYTCLKIRFERS